jgi:hypothetical protein
MSMEVSIGCGAASVSIIDENSAPIVSFNDIPVIGNSDFCSNSAYGNFDADFAANPGQDFQSE